MEIAALAAEGHQQNLPERCVRGRGVSGNPNRDVFLRHVEQNRPMQIVPPREQTRPVAVRLVEAIGVMDAVHARRDDDAHEDALHRHRQAHVCVMKKDRYEEDGLPEPQGLRIDADEEHLRGAHRNRQCQLAEIETQSRRRIQIAIDVMDEMKAPEKRDAMAGPMPPPERVIHQHDGEGDFQPARETRHLQQADVLPHDPRGERLE
jgi:hypothetical protein